MNRLTVSISIFIRLGFLGFNTNYYSSLYLETYVRGLLPRDRARKMEVILSNSRGNDKLFLGGRDDENIGTDRR